MDVITTTKLARDFAQAGWNLYPVFQLGILVADVPKSKDAIKAVRQYTDLLAQAASHLGLLEAIVRINAKDFYSIPARMANTDMSNSTLILDPNKKLIELYSFSMSPSLWREVGWFLDHPEQAGGIVRLRDEQQIAMSHANSQKNADFTAGAGVEKAVTWKRTDYWHPGDLADFDLTCNQKLEPNNPDSWVEYSWRSFDPDLGIQSPDGWIRFVNRCKRVIDEEGNIYNISHNLGMEIIKQPLGV